jgi:EmrB/QacA subfamily drug resistance transporter
VVAQTEPSVAGSLATPVVASAAAFLASLDLFIVNIAFPGIRHAFHGPNLGTISWILNGYTVVFAAFLSPAGRLGDRYGHRSMFLWGLAVFTVGSAACGLSGSLGALIASRVLQAVGAAMLMPNSLALLLAAVQPSRRAAAVSGWSAAAAMAAALGPPVGGLLVELSWRWIFFVNLPFGLLALVVGPRVLARSRASEAGVPDLFGAASLVLGIGALVWVLIELPTASGAAATRVVIAAAGAGCALTFAVWRSMRHPTPALDLAAVRVGPMWSGCLSLMLFAAAFGAMLLGNVLFLTTVWHESAVVAGVCLSPSAVIVVAVSLTFAGRLVARFGVGAVAASGAVLFVLGVGVWLWRIGSHPDYFGAFLPGQLFTGAGVGLVMPSLSAVAGLSLPARRWGTGSAFFNAARQVGMVVGTTALALIYERGVDMTSIRRGWLFLAVAAGAAALLAATLAVRWPSPAPNSSEH